MVLSKKANNKGADQTARMRRLVCACVDRKHPKIGFLVSRSSEYKMSSLADSEDPDECHRKWLISSESAQFAKTNDLQKTGEKMQ